MVGIGRICWLDHKEMATKSQQAFSWSRLILRQYLRNPPQSPNPYFSRKLSTFNFFPRNPSSKCYFFLPRASYSTDSYGWSPEDERQWQKETEELLRSGPDGQDDEDEDYMGVGPLIEKLEKANLKEDLDWDALEEEPTDSDSEDEDDERFSPEAQNKSFNLFQRKFKRHEELLHNLTDAGNFPWVLLMPCFHMPKYNFVLWY